MRKNVAVILAGGTGKRLGLATFTGMVVNEMTDEQYRLPYPDIENELAGRQ